MSDEELKLVIAVVKVAVFPVDYFQTPSMRLSTGASPRQSKSSVAAGARTVAGRCNIRTKGRRIRVRTPRRAEPLEHSPRAEGAEVVGSGAPSARSAKQIGAG